MKAAHWHHRSQGLKLISAAGLAALALSAPAAACQLSATTTSTVVAIADGRTLKLDDNSELRLTSLLAPTPLDSPAAETSRTTEHQAVTTLARLANGKSVGIKAVSKAPDRYGRRLGHAFLRGVATTAEKVPIVERWLQARIVRAGHARVMPSSQLEADCTQVLLNEEAKAETARLGLWNEALYSPKRAEDARRLLNYRGTYQIVEGVIARVSLSRSGAYLNFGRDWKQDFTIRVNRIALARKPLAREALKRLRKQPVRVRGWIEKRNGPLIQVWRLEQIELVSVTDKGEINRAIPPRVFTTAPR